MIGEDDLCVYLCESPREIADVNALEYTYIRNKVEAMKARRKKMEESSKGSQKKPSEAPMPTSSRSSSLRNELLHSIRNNTKLQKLQRQQQQQQQQNIPDQVNAILPEDFAPAVQTQQQQPNDTGSSHQPLSGPPSPTHVTSTALRHSISSESNRSSNQSHQHQPSPPPRQNFTLSRLPTPRLALLTGSRKLISRLGQMSALEQSELEIESSPVCYLLEKAATRQELTLDSTEFLSGHILVCMHHKVSNIFKFIYNLRYVNS